MFKMNNRKIIDIVTDCKTLNEALDRIYHDFPHEHKDRLLLASRDAVRMNVSKVLKTVKSLRGMKKEAFLDEDFIIPSVRVLSEQGMRTKLQEQKQTIRVLKQQTESLKNKNEHLEEENASLVDSEENLAQKYCNCLSKLVEIQNTAVVEETYNELEEKYETQSQELHKVLKELASANTRNANKKIRRRDEKIKDLKRQLSETSCNVEILEQKNTDLEIEIAEINNEKVSLQKSRWYYKTQADTKAKDLDNKIDIMMGEIDSLKKSNAILEKVNQAMESVEVETFHDGAYTSEIREVCYELLNLGVGVKNVSYVIRTVLTKLLDAEIGRLPSQTLLTTMVIESKILSQLQASKEILKDKENISCIHTDGTSKYGEHFASVQVTTPSGQYSLGLMDLDSGTSENYFDCIKTIFQDMADLLHAEQEEGSVLCSLVKSIKNIQTDRHVVNTKLTDILRNWRKNLIEENHDLQDFTEDEKDTLFRLNQFNCLLHFLVNMATQAEEGLKTWENLSKETKSTSQTVDLIRRICKSFQKHGSEQAGVMSVFSAFIDDKVKLSKFKGNRFNIIFHNGAAAYYHIPAIRRFFELWGTPNLLLQSVAKDIESRTLVAGIRALGIIDKIVSGPLWKIINKSGNVLSVLPYLDTLKIKLNSWSSDAYTLLLGETCFDTELTVKDCLYEALFRDPQEEVLNALTQEALEVLCTYFMLSLHRCTTDMNIMIASGGDQLRRETRIVPPTNVISERDFAGLDRLIRARPNATTLNMEATVLYLNNKTADWLTTLSKEEKDKYISEAMSKAPSAVRKYKERKLNILQRKKERLEKKKNEKLKAEQNKREEVRKVLNELPKYGGEWKNEEQMEKELGKIKTESQKRTALFLQLKYHKIILNSTAERFCFNRTKNGKPLSISQMKQNLIKVIGLDSDVIDTSTSVATSNFEIQDQDRQMRLKSLKDQVLAKLKKLEGKKQPDENVDPARINLIAQKNAEKSSKPKSSKKSRPKTKKLKRLKPQDLLYRYCEHTFDDETTGDRVSYYGTVIEIVHLDETNPKNTIFLIEYDVDVNDDNSDSDNEDDDEPQTQFEYNLLEDFYNGDLVLLDE